MSSVAKVFLNVFVVLILSLGAASAQTPPQNPPPVQTQKNSGNFDEWKGDKMTKVLCNIINYVNGPLGRVLMTMVVIGTSLLAIFGRMPWPALFTLLVFIAVFFGAAPLVVKFSGETAAICEPTA